jgi:hypothetical protein
MNATVERISEFLTTDAARPDVSIVMPCLNEAISLPHCIGRALETLARLRVELGLSGEIVIADNGSTDGSQALATELGARVVPVTNRGYGAALIGGCHAALGTYILMGDCDGSYDFTEGVAMIEELVAGRDLCMGNRFRGGVAPGAMPWKNRYIGNPALTGILNVFFRTGMGDAHCGLRAIRKDAFAKLKLTGSGMEFASEMVIKAALMRLNMAEVPATLSPDLRQRAPHLRPWRDGWRHLRYLFMLSPTWVFAVPGLLAVVLAAVILGVAAAHGTGLIAGASFFGASWSVVGAFLATSGHFCLICAVAMHLHGVRSGYRRLRPIMTRLAPVLTLEHALVTGASLVVASLAALLAVGAGWAATGYAALVNPLPLITAAMLGAIGIQTVIGGFMIAIIAGNDNRFTPRDG